MEPARAALEAVLASVPIRAPSVPVWSNVTGRPMLGDAGEIRALLARQLVEPVQWEAILVSLAGGGGGASPGDAPRLHELGPGTQIKSMVRRVSSEAWRAMVNVSPV